MYEDEDAREISSTEKRHQQGSTKKNESVTSGVRGRVGYTSVDVLRSEDSTVPANTRDAKKN